MPYRICRTFEIENGHMLSLHPDKCRFPHGHTRKVELTLQADTLDPSGMVCDFKALKQTLAAYLDTYDHALCMNTSDPAYADFKSRYGERILGFADEEPTTEVMARTMFHACQQLLATASASPAADVRYPLRPDVRLVSLRLWETSATWAEYTP